MSIPRTVAHVMGQHVTLELECLDRVYLNVYQPKLQYPKAVYDFLREFYGPGAVSSRKMRTITERFLTRIDDYAQEHDIPIVRFEKNQRKEEVAAEYLREFPDEEGILLIGKAQEKGRALRPELVVHNPNDFGVGRKLENLSALKEIGFATNRRVLHVQKTSQDFAMSEGLFREVTGRRDVNGQRVSALRWGDPLVMALFSVLLLFRMLPCGFRSRDLREHVAPLLGDDPSQWTEGRRTYQVRRLRLHGLIARIPGTQRYEVTDRGLAVALWCTRCHARLFRPALGELIADAPSAEATLRRAIAQFDRHIDRYLEKAKLKAAA